MRTTSKFLAVALTASLQSAMAGTIPLNFEDLTTLSKLNGNYHGVNISGSAWGGTSEVCNGDISFLRAGSCGALWLAVDPTQRKTGKLESLTMSIADGFEGLSFLYSGNATLINLSVHVYDAAGAELGIGLTGLTGQSCANYQFCNWSQPITLNFTGLARSVTFSALDQAVLLDDLTFKTPSTTGRLPEPTSVALALAALGGLAWSRKRKAG
ncbi:MAG: PEP-CTERM sorting domain-containing protein [Burkholderiales bacterium]|nr:MAG: PEP-CTERM sorting domain-containing protein [Burkholderiales bacterium]